MVGNFQPTSLKEALDILATENLTLYCGGTDLMVNPDENANYLFINKIPEIKNIIEDKEYIRIGAACTFTDVLENNLTPDILRDAVFQIGAPAIRNIGTVGGNICNGSAKADCALIFFVTDSKLRLISRAGERIIPIKQFYLGKKKTDILQGEILAEILMNKTGFNNYYYKKVGARRALAISRVSFVGIFNIIDGKIVDCKTAFGAVTDIFISRPDIDNMLIGKTIEEAKAVKGNFLAAYDQAIVPIEGRISAEYRKSVCMNLLDDFLNDLLSQD